MASSRFDIARLQELHQFLEDHYSVWETKAAIGVIKNHLNIIITELRKRGDWRNSKSPASKLRTTKLTLADKLDTLDDILETYASDIGDQALRNKADNSHVDYMGLKSDIFVSKVINMISCLEIYVSEMEDYGLKKSQIDQCKMLLDQFLDLQGLPRRYQRSKFIERKPTEYLIKEAHLQIRKLDNEMSAFRQDNIRFYLSYEQLRSAALDDYN